MPGMKTTFPSLIFSQLWLSGHTLANGTKSRGQAAASRKSQETSDMPTLALWPFFISSAITCLECRHTADQEDNGHTLVMAE